MARKLASKKDYDNLLNYINSFTIAIVKENKLNNNLFESEYINNDVIINIKKLDIDFLNQYLELGYNDPIMNINYSKYKDAIIIILICKAREALTAWEASPAGRDWMQERVAFRNKSLAEALIREKETLKKEEADRAILLKKIKEEAEGWDPVAFLESCFKYDENHIERFLLYDTIIHIHGVSTEMLTMIIDNILLSINHKKILKKLLSIAFTARDLSRGGTGDNFRKFQTYNFGKLALYYNILKNNDLQ